jgi:hypothetical protein
MSLATSLLLAFLPAIVRPKPEPEKIDRNRELEGEVRRLHAELERAWARNEELALERDSARRQEPARIAAYQQAAAALMQQQGALMQQQGALMQQQAALMQQQANPLGLYQEMNAQAFAHCVPGRHEALLGGVLGA